MTEVGTIGIKIQASGAKEATREFTAVAAAGAAVEASTKKMVAPAAAASKGLKNLGSTAGKTSTEIKNLKALVQQLAPALTALGAIKILGDAIRTVMDFEAAMANVGAVSGATAAEMEKLSAAAQKLGATSVFSASQVAEAQYHLASAGLQVNQIIQAQTGVAALAAATQSDLALASATVASTLSQFGLKAEESNRIANVFAASIGKSQANMDKLSNSMKYVGPIANSLGQNLETTTAQLMALYDAGLDGSQAGTALRSMMLRLQNPVAGVRKALDSLGVSLVDATGKSKSFSQINEELASKNLTVAQSTAIYGQEAAAAGVILAANAEKIRTNTEAITGTNTATEAAAKQLNNLKGDVTQLMSALEGQAILIGGQVTPVLRVLTQAAIDLSDNIGTITIGLAAAGAAWVLWTGYLQLATTTAASFAAQMVRLRAVMAAHPLLIAAGVISAVVFAFDALTESADEARQKWTAQTDAIIAANDAYQKAIKGVEDTTRAMADLQAEAQKALGDKEKERALVEKLDKLYPDLELKYLDLAGALEKVSQKQQKVLAGYREEALKKYAESVEAANAALADNTNMKQWITIADRLAMAADQASSGMNNLPPALKEADFMFQRMSTNVSGFIEQQQKLGKIIAGLPLTEEGRKLAIQLTYIRNQLLEIARSGLQAIKDGGGQLTAAQGILDDYLQSLVAVAAATNAIVITPDPVEPPGTIDPAIIQRNADERKRIEQQLADDVYNLHHTSAEQRIRDLDRIVEQYSKAGGDKAKIEKDLAALRKGIWAESVKDLAESLAKEAEEAEKAAKEKAEAEKKLARERAEFRGDQLEIMRLKEEDFYAEAERLGIDFTEAQKILAERRAEDNKSSLDKMLEAWMDTDKLIEEATAETLRAIQQSWTSLIKDTLTGEINDLGDFWSRFCDSLLDIWVNMIAQMIAEWALSGIASIFKDLLDLFSGDFSFGNLFGGGETTPLSIVGDAVDVASAASTLATAGTAIVGIAEGIAAISEIGAIGGLDAALTAMGGVVEWATGGMVGSAATAAYSAVVEAAVAESISAKVAAVAAEIAAEAAAETAVTTAAGTTAVETASTTAATTAATEAAAGMTMGSFAATAAAGILGTALFGELVVGLLGDGMVGPIGALFGQENKLTPEQAQKMIADSLETTAGVTGVRQGMQDIGGQVSGRLWNVMGGGGAAQQLNSESLAAIAGYTPEQVDAMVASLGPAAEVTKAIGLASEAAGSKINQMVHQLEIGGVAMDGTAADTARFEKRVLQLAESLNLPAEYAQALQLDIRELVSEYKNGEMGTEQLASALQNTFTEALLQASDGAGLTAEAVEQMTLTMHLVPTNDITANLMGMNGTLGESTARLDGLNQALFGVDAPARQVIDGANFMSEAFTRAVEGANNLTGASIATSAGAETLGFQLDTATDKVMHLTGTIESWATPTIQVMTEGMLEATKAVSEELTPGVIDFSAQALEASGAAGDLANAIQSIPTQWESNVQVNISENVRRQVTEVTSTIPEQHTGGLVRPVGGDGLSSDEVLRVLQAQEYVIRKSSVNPDTLATLEYINRTGRVPISGDTAGPVSAGAEVRQIVTPVPKAGPVNLAVTVVTQDGRTLRKEVYADMGQGGGPTPKAIKINGLG